MQGPRKREPQEYSRKGKEINLPGSVYSHCIPAVFLRFPLRDPGLRDPVVSKIQERPHVGIVFKWLQYGALYHGSDDAYEFLQF